MSKGSKVRPMDRDKFKAGFDKIKWGDSGWKPPEKVQKEQLYHIMPDIEPYQAVGGVDAGSMITSRSKEREYLKRNNAVQVGNEKDFFFRHNGKSPDNPTKDW